MKNFNYLAILSIAFVMVASCTKQEKIDNIDFMDQTGVLKSAYVDISYWPGDDGCGLEVYDLFGGQTIDMGTVSVLCCICCR